MRHNSTLRNIDPQSDNRLTHSSTTTSHERYQFKLTDITTHHQPRLTMQTSNQQHQPARTTGEKPNTRTNIINLHATTGQIALHMSGYASQRKQHEHQVQRLTYTRSCYTSNYTSNDGNLALPGDLVFNHQRRAARVRGGAITRQQVGTATARSPF